MKFGKSRASRQYNKLYAYSTLILSFPLQLFIDGWLLRFELSLILAAKYYRREPPKNR